MKQIQKQKKTSRTKRHAFFCVPAWCVTAFLAFAAVFAAEISVFHAWSVAGMVLARWQFYVFPFLTAVLAASLVCAVQRQKSVYMWISGAVCLAAFVCGFEFLLHPSVSLMQVQFAAGKAAAQNEQRTFDGVERLETDSDFSTLLLMDPDVLSYWDAEKTDALIEMSEQMPEQLMNLCSQITFLSSEKFDSQMDAPEGEITDINSQLSVLGYSNQRYGTVFLRVPDTDGKLYKLNKDGSRVFLNDPMFLQETLVHELVHLSDVQMEGSQLFASSTPEWKELYKKYSLLLGDYASTNPQEFFAEAGVYYYLYPEQLSLISQEIYDTFESLQQHLA